MSNDNRQLSVPLKRIGHFDLANIHAQGKKRFSFENGLHAPLIATAEKGENRRVFHDTLANFPMVEDFAKAGHTPEEGYSVVTR